MSNTSATSPSASQSTTTPAREIGPELKKLKADTKAARKKFNDEGDGIRASMLAMFEERVLPHCDNADANIDFYRRFLTSITSGELKDLRAFALKIPSFIRVADEQLRGINVDEAPSLPTKNPATGRTQDKIPSQHSRAPARW